MLRAKNIGIKVLILNVFLKLLNTVNFAEYSSKTEKKVCFALDVVYKMQAKYFH